jgi:hypothetical protein
MKTFLLVAALGIGTAFTPAFACDWNKEASNNAPVVTACVGSGCATERTTGESTTSQPAEPASTVEPASKVACPGNGGCATEDQSNSSVPTTLACGNSNGC